LASHDDSTECDGRDRFHVLKRPSMKLLGIRRNTYCVKLASLKKGHVSNQLLVDNNSDSAIARTTSKGPSGDLFDFDQRLALDP